MQTTQYKMQGMAITEYVLDVPLDWQHPQADKSINLFVREVVASTKTDEELPLLLFLQGGPGGKSPRPMPNSIPWLLEALKSHRVILLDQRGTGRSSRIDSDLMKDMSAEVGRDYLLKFRADSIVQDCEYIRRHIYNGRLFETLGQSYGGFITLAYLSQAPEGLAACYITGGLAGIDADAETIYRLTYQRLLEKNALFYQRYPNDANKLNKIAKILTEQEVYLPDGDKLSLERFQSIGLSLGMGPGIDQIHWLLDEVFTDCNEDKLSDVFLDQVMHLTSYYDNPLFAAIHESIYGLPHQKTNWAAQKIRAEFQEFMPDHNPMHFTGEMIYPWMFEQIESLKAFAPAAEALAHYEDYQPLYNKEVLKNNQVPVMAAVYHEDMYVPRELSLATAKVLGNCQVWLTNSYEHDGVRQSSEVFTTLRKMLLDQGGPLKKMVK